MFNQPKVNFMPYTVNVTDFDTRSFETDEQVSAFVVSFVNDEYNETENPPVLTEMWRAFAELYTGLASGGDFTVRFCGETIEVKVEA